MYPPPPPPSLPILSQFSLHYHPVRTIPSRIADARTQHPSLRQSWMSYCSQQGLAVWLLQGPFVLRKSSGYFLSIELANNHHAYFHQCRECQRADWPKHREYCSPRDLRSEDALEIHAYSRHHHNNFLALALCFFSFTSDFSHLEGSDRRRWLPCSQKQFLHITLHRVSNGFRGRHNKITFATARLSDIDILPDDIPSRIRGRLEARFPALCLGYSIVDSPDASQYRISTYTHPFPWLTPGFPPLRISKVVRSVWLNEWILQQEAAEVQSERKKAKARK